MKIDYTKIGDYYIPNILPPERVDTNKIGKYGRLRLKYLKNYKKAEYTILLMDNELEKHLVEVDKVAKREYEMIINNLKKELKIDEKMKENNQMMWVKMMNNISNSANEIVLKEYVYNDKM